jgi:hypothetical protein
MKTKTETTTTLKTCVNINCPNCLIIPDPDPHDWFCDDDVAAVCKLAKQKVKPNSIYKVDTQPFKPITCACRPYMIKKETTIPKWCPLKKA